MGIAHIKFTPMGRNSPRHLLMFPLPPQLLRRLKLETAVFGQPLTFEKTWACWRSVWEDTETHAQLLRYGSDWEISLWNHSCNIPSESSWHRQVRNQHIFCVKWRDTMDHNKIGTLHLVWAVTPEQIKINSKLFLLGTWCHSLMWFETQSTVKKKIISDFAVRTGILKSCLRGCNDG